MIYQNIISIIRFIDKIINNYITFQINISILLLVFSLFLFTIFKSIVIYFLFFLTSINNRGVVKALFVVEISINNSFEFYTNYVKTKVVLYLYKTFCNV